MTDPTSRAVCDNRISMQATFSCVSCGFSMPADLNAAQNIRSRASADVTKRESSQANTYAA